MSKKSLFLKFVGALGILTLGACIGTSTDVPNHSTNAGLSSQVASSSAANANFDSRAYGDGILSDVRMLDPEPITGVFSSQSLSSQTSISSSGTLSSAALSSVILSSSVVNTSSSAVSSSTEGQVSSSSTELQVADTLTWNKCLWANSTTPMANADVEWITKDRKVQHTRTNDQGCFRIEYVATDLPGSLGVRWLAPDNWYWYSWTPQVDAFQNLRLSPFARQP